MSLKGTGHGPELAGPNFLAKWGAQPLSKLISYNFELMPPQAPGSLGESVNVDITAHMLRVNGGVAGDEALQADFGLLVGAAIGVEIGDSAEAVEGEEKKAALSAVYSIFAFITVPFLIFVVPRMVPSLHPADSIVDENLRFTMSPTIRIVFFSSLALFTGLFVWMYTLGLRVQKMIRAQIDEE